MISIKQILLLLLFAISIRGFAQMTHKMPMKEEGNPPAKNQSPAEIYENSKPGTVHIGKTVEYDLYVKDTIVNFTGRKRHAIAINGQIPAPTLTFIEGDTAIIRVHNLMHMETSIHWHGILLPNREDGVPNLTTAPIEPGSTYTFTFPIIQNGTFWYHSHTMLQEQIGLYGALVLQPAKKQYDLKEQVLVLSDWTDEKPYEVQRYLKRAGEWYAIKKGALQSYSEAIAKGYFKDKIRQEWQRMPAMDVSDVYYKKFLSNGQEALHVQGAKPGEIIRLRIINGSASSYFTLQYAGGNMQVISADGINIQPFPINKLEIATAETYDLLITVPANGAYELRSTVSDVSGYTSVFFGDGKEMKAPDLPRLNYFAMMREMNNMGSMDMSSTGSMNMSGMHSSTTTNPSMNSADADMNMEGMNMGMDRAFSYDMLRALSPTTLDSTKNLREYRLKLTGNMLRYVWSINYKTLSAADKIMIRHGENVRLIFENTTMMRHPIHLHGHFFRMVNSQGEYSPLKHTFDIRPMETVTIEFDANEQQDWFLHCHILYHMMVGMARIVSYEGSEQNEFAKKGYRKLKREDNKLYPWFDLSVHTQAAWLETNISNNKYALEFEGRVTYKGDFETETHLLRYVDKNQYFAPFIGFDVRNNKTLNPNDKTNNKNNRRVFDFGFYYLLPLLIRSEWRMDHTGRFRIELERRDIPLSNHFFLDLSVNTDLEYTFGLRYMFSKYFSASTLYDSDYKLGIGLTMHY